MVPQIWAQLGILAQFPGLTLDKGHHYPRAQRNRSADNGTINDLQSPLSLMCILFSNFEIMTSPETKMSSASDWESGVDGDFPVHKAVVKGRSELEL